VINRTSTLTTFALCLALLAGLPTLGCAQQNQNSGGSIWEESLRIGMGAASERAAQKQREEEEKKAKSKSSSSKIKYLSSTDEQYLGQLSAELIVQGLGPLAADIPLQRYVNLVGRTVAKQSQRDDLIHAFGVIESENIGAWAAPGGWVFVSTGLLKKLQTESELAGILAGQLAHIALRDAETRLDKDTAMRAAKNSVNEDQRLGHLEGAAKSVADLVLNEGYGTELTYAADAAATRMLASAGYDPNGLRNAMLRVDDSGAKRIGAESKLENRIPELQAMLASELAGMTGAVNQDRYLASVALLRVKKGSATPKSAARLESARPESATNEQKFTHRYSF
jgi:hypothetical protein